MSSPEKRPMFKRSIETQLLIDLLARAEPGDLITYEEMKDACGVDCQRARHALLTARRHLLKHERKGFAAVKGEGVQRLDANGMVEAAQDGLRRVRKCAHRETERIVYGVPDIQELSEENRHRYNARRCMLELLRGAASGKNEKLAIEAVKKRGGVIPQSQLLKSLAESVGS